MSKYKIFTRDTLTKEMYLKTWELDNRTFEAKDRISKKLALEWFKYSGGSTSVLWDMEKDCMVGYISAFLLNHNFSKRYIISNENFKKAITKETFCDLDNDKSGDIYFFSIVVEEEYRGRVLRDSDEKSKFHAKPAVQILTEAFCDWVCFIKEKGISINYVYAEKVNAAGEKYLRSLGLQPCFNIKDDVKFAKLFTPKIFARCSNKNKLYKLYKKEASFIRNLPIIGRIVNSKLRRNTVSSISSVRSISAVLSVYIAKRFPSTSVIVRNLKLSFFYLERRCLSVSSVGSVLSIGSVRSILSVFTVLSVFAFYYA